VGETDLFEPFTAQLRDGRSVLVRRRAEGDLATSRELDMAIAAAGVGGVWSIDELQERTLQTPEDFRGDADELLLIAMDNAMAVGEVGVRRYEASRVHHVGSLGIGVHPDWQGVGLGRVLMDALLDWARKPETGLHRVELNVFSDNAAAIGLYESLGFTHEGRRRDFVRYEDGSFADDLVMGLIVGDER
jgi:putative acetyltransferase